MYTIGIDGGLDGGIVVYHNKKIIEKHIMPTFKGAKGRTYDIKSIINILKKYDPNDTLIILEKAHTMLINGARANFTIGECYGMMKAIIIVLSFPFDIVAARTWQKEIFQGQTVKDTKQASIEYCRNRFPDIDWRASERCKKDHDGMTDAACLAVYGTRL